MVEIFKGGAFLINGKLIPDDEKGVAELKRLGRVVSPDDGRKKTMSWAILSAHNSGDEQNFKLKFDSMTSHDITYVGIIQTARASGMDSFPVPYVLTNCHNTLCAVGGTINEDDHVFALSAAEKYGGIYVPPHLAVIHSYNREMMAGCGKMILGSDSHTRYGALGTMAVGEGGGELAKQLVGRTYDMARPEVVAVYLTGSPRNGVGPHDVSLAIIAAVFEKGFVKNKVMEFIGDGIANLPVDFRNGIDVMSTETTCWSSIWKTDGKVREYLETHGRGEDYRELSPSEGSYYDGVILVDLSTIEPSIAMPFHPSKVFTIRELKENAADILAKTEEEANKAIGVPGLSVKLREKLRGGEIFVDQGIIAGCSGGTFNNIMAAADILEGASVGNREFSLSVYPDSQPVFAELVKNGAIGKLIAAGAIVRSAFCGPCFGAGDTPANGGFSIRHTTRNFPNREGSKPSDGQIASVALMDARSIAATAANGGRLTAAGEGEGYNPKPSYFFDRGIYAKRVYDGSGKPAPEKALITGPNIKDWPPLPELTEDLLLRIVSYIDDPVTTTDELIPSGETSSYRSNPLRLAEFTLSRRDPEYVGKAKAVQALEQGRQKANITPDLVLIYERIKSILGYEDAKPEQAALGSAIYANKPGDGSAREQAASCQRVLGASANFAREYATKRYRSNLINWGILPFLVQDPSALKTGDFVFLPSIREALLGKADAIKAYVLSTEPDLAPAGGRARGGASEIRVSLGSLTDTERHILADGCLINYYKHPE
ncbi:aconitase family protein [Treponema primitia ZAS-2]|uniref:Aconitase family protein n=1 Tax=Treponema primitia (strain ATCC BAA-887 / DSM 12427 / ZAS-2) TaxID=545694 RepID=F5YM14_TREPZ|nr:hydratase [Treponema primitia]AEF83675.1 aconitase family protein [Treponema primitia ZAS-2]